MYKEGKTIIYEQKCEEDRLQLGLQTLAGYCALDEAVGVGLRCKDGCVLAGVLHALVPAQI